MFLFQSTANVPAKSPIANLSMHNADLENSILAWRKSPSNDNINKVTIFALKTIDAASLILDPAKKVPENSPQYQVALRTMMLAKRTMEELKNQGFGTSEAFKVEGVTVTVANVVDHFKEGGTFAYTTRLQNAAYHDTYFKNYFAVLFSPSLKGADPISATRLANALTDAAYSESVTLKMPFASQAAADAFTKSASAGAIPYCSVVGAPSVTAVAGAFAGNSFVASITIEYNKNWSPAPMAATKGADASISQITFSPAMSTTSLKSVRRLPSSSRAINEEYIKPKLSTLPSENENSGTTVLYKHLDLSYAKLFKPQASDKENLNFIVKGLMTDEANYLGHNVNHAKNPPLEEFLKQPEGKKFAETMATKISGTYASATMEALYFEDKAKQQDDYKYYSGQLINNWNSAAGNREGMGLESLNDRLKSADQSLSINEKNLTKRRDIYLLQEIDAGLMAKLLGDKNVPDSLKNWLQNKGVYSDGSGYSAEKVQRNRNEFMGALLLSDEWAYNKFMECMAIESNGNYSLKTEAASIKALNELLINKVKGSAELATKEDGWVYKISRAKSLRNESDASNSVVSALVGMNDKQARCFGISVAGNVELKINVEPFDVSTSEVGGSPCANFTVSYNFEGNATKFNLGEHGNIRGEVYDSEGNKKDYEVTITTSGDGFNASFIPEKAGKYSLVLWAETSDQRVNSDIAGRIVRVEPSPLARQEVPVVQPLRVKSEIPRTYVSTTPDMASVKLIPGSTKMDASPSMENIYGSGPFRKLVDLVNGGGLMNQLYNPANPLDPATVYGSIMASEKLPAWENSIKPGYTLQNFFQTLITDPAKAFSMVKEGTPLYNLTYVVFGPQASSNKDVARVAREINRGDINVSINLANFYRKNSSVPSGTLVMGLYGGMENGVTTITPVDEKSFKPFSITEDYTRLGGNLGYYIVPWKMLASIGFVNETKKTKANFPSQESDFAKSSQSALTFDVAKFFDLTRKINQFVLTTQASGFVPLNSNQWGAAISLNLRYNSQGKLSPFVRTSFQYAPNTIEPYSLSGGAGLQAKIFKNLSLTGEVDINKPLGPMGPSTKGFGTTYRIGLIYTLPTVGSVGAGYSYRKDY